MFRSAPRFDRPTSAWSAQPLAWVVVPLIVGVALFCAQLWREWSHNPDLSHGFFAPLIFALLVWEGTKTGRARWIQPSVISRAVLGLLLVGALGMLTVAGLLAASLGWNHAVVLFCFAVVLVCSLGAGLIVLADERVRAVPCNWPIVTAILLWLLVAPLPTGTYARVMLTLQHAVTTGVLNALHLFGIPARQMGNIIELATTSVGVEDACSGIRSLISCTYAGLFFAAWLVRSPGKRVALILVAPVLAVAMNFARSLLLTLLANAGKEINGFWHDTTGFAILGLTAAMLAGLASLLSPSGVPTATATEPLPSAPNRSDIPGFAAGAAAIIALGAIFFVVSRPTAAVNPAPERPVAQLLPTKADGWQVETTADLKRFSGILQTEHLVERTYLRLRDGQPIQINVYIAHWSAGAASVSLVASHTPDACWPGSGWKTEELPNRQMALQVAGRTMAPAEHRAFRFGNLPQQVWFWHIYNGRVINYRDPYSIPALLEIALNYGFRREGSQYFVRFSSNVPWEQIRDEPLVHEIFANLGPIGLQP